MVTPMIWYQKLNTLAYKYQFIIEKYGYLKESEKQNMINELKNQGFLTENIEIIAPATKKNYGQLIEFEIKYKCPRDVIMFSNNKLNIKKEYIDFSIKKASYSKN